LYAQGDLIRQLTYEGIAVARDKGTLKGKKSELSRTQRNELRRTHDTGEYSIGDLGDVFNVSRNTIYRTMARQPDLGRGLYGASLA
jgi:IS30 family transposase